MLVVQTTRVSNWWTAQALAGINALAPGFLGAHPDVAFALQRARFQAAAAAGDSVGALQLARSELSPLAQACPHLLPQLKARTAGQSMRTSLFQIGHSLVVHGSVGAMRLARSEPTLRCYPALPFSACAGLLGPACRSSIWGYSVQSTLMLF